MQTNVKGKKIILAITGSIAAYKSAFLVRLLVKQGAEVQVLMTESATQFITPLTLSTLSNRPVYTSVIAEDSWNSHVELGLWADAMVVAPATATSLAKLANGISDNMVVATYLSARCPVFVAPAMDLDMWHHPSTKRNLAFLQSDGVHVIPVGYGPLASGLVGDGRMAEPEDIVSFLADFWSKKQDLKGKNILVTAGPTYEAIDPVRFIGNRSSGKMGIAIAENLAQRGALVHLVLGPSKLSVAHPNVQMWRVESAADMYAQAVALFPNMDAAVLAAAVADYKPKTVAKEKIKKKKDGLELILTKTEDIAAELGQMKQKNQIIVGFALETQNEEDNAVAKLRKKRFDFVVLNSLRDEGAGFNVDTNKISIIFDEKNKRTFELKDKKAVAQDIVDALVECFAHTPSV